MRWLIPKAAAAMVAALALWSAFGVLAVVAPGGPRLGLLPPWWLLVVFALLTSAAAWKTRRSWLTLFAFAPLVLPWLPSRIPAAFLIWTGPLPILIAAAVLLAVAFQLLRSHGSTWSAAFVDPYRAPLAVAIVSIVLYGAAAWRVAPMIPGGDEPHYLVITQSLLYDFDLEIENNHARGDYRSYVEMDLRPDYIVRGTDGKIYSIHMPGISLLVAPAFLLAGHPGAVALIVLLAAVAGALLWRLLLEVTGDAGAAWFGWAAIALSVPIVFHSFTIYPDSAAVLPVVIGVLALLRATGHSAGSETRLGPWFGYGAVLAALPWLHSRFALLAGGFGALILLRLLQRPNAVRKAAAFLALPVLSAAGWFAFFQIIYGSPNPRAQYGGLLDATSSPAFITSGIGGLLFDQQFGILTHAPAYACGLAGIALMLRGRPTAARTPVSQARLAGEILLLVTPYLVSTTTVRMWWGGWSAPGRFLVALLPLFGFGAAVAWQRAERRATRAVMLGALALSAAMSGTLVWVDRGRLAYDVRQTDALWLQWAGPLADLARGVPTFLRSPEPAAWIQSGVWVIALVAAWLLVRASERLVRSRPAVALALVAVYAAAGMAAMTVVWRLNGSNGVQPALAQLDLLRAAAVGNGIGVAFEPLARVRPDGIPNRLTIVADARHGAGRDGQLMALPGPIPAGDYTVIPLPTGGSAGRAPAPPTHGHLSAGIGREFVPLWSTALDESSPFDVSFPVDVRAIVVRGDEQAVSWIKGMAVRPRSVVPVGDRAGGGYARQAVRYPGSVVYFMDEGVFPEPNAFWIRGGRSATVVFDPEAPASATALFIRNAPVANTLRIDAGGWHDELTLAPGEERRISIPSNPLVRGTLVRFASASGFRPSEVVPSSEDRRFLGVWVRPD